MREYETVYISHPSQSDANIRELNDRLTGIIGTHKGRLFFSRSLGRRSLAYPIGKESKGTYTSLDFAAEGGAVSEIERILRYDETVLRFLTVVKNHEIDIDARAQEIALRGEDVATPEEGTKEESNERDVSRER